MISKELLKEILLEQRKRIEDLKKEDFVKREELNKIKKFTKIKSSIIITGVRRCGKSIFLLQIINNFFDDYYYINFEDERLAKFTVDDFNRLYEVFIELFGKNGTFFLDEVQNIVGWEKWVRRMYEDKFKFFITGSNAKLLSKELATVLTGRNLQFSIYPFSFKEFLIFNKFKPEKNDVYITERRALISKYLSEYSKKGGFPEFLESNNIEILQGYFNDIIQKDIVERYNVENIKQIKELGRYILTNSGNLTSYNQLKKLTELKSVNTVIKYFSYLENSYLIFSIPYFSYSIKKQNANPFKIYSIDVGLRDAMSFKFSKDAGRIYENLVAIELKRRNKEVYYWKNVQHEEVDFVIKEGLKVKQLIQVCYDIESENVKKREIKSLINASKELKCNNLIVITEDYGNSERVDNKKVIYTPLWKWLLDV